MDDLIIHLEQIERKMRWRDFWELSQRTLWLPALGLLTIQLLARIIPISNLWQLSISPWLLWLFVVMIYARFRASTHMQIAIKADIELKLLEKLSTALFLQNMAFETPLGLVRAQEKDALQSIRNLDLTKEFHIKRYVSRLSISAIFSLFAILAMLIPNPMDEVLAERTRVETAAEEQADIFEEFIADLDASEELSPEEKQDLIRQLEELVEKLRSNPGDLEEALSDLTKAEKALNEKLEPNATSRQANLESLARRLSNLTESEYDPSADQVDAIQSSLTELFNQLSEMDSSQRQELARNLAQLAGEANQSGNDQLGEALASISQDLLSGELNGLDQSVNEAKKAAEIEFQRLTNQENIEQLITQIEGSSLALAQAGKSTTQGSQSNGSQNSNTADGSGQNAGNSQGAVTGGGGTTADVLPPGTSKGIAGVPDGDKPPGSEEVLTSDAFIPRIEGPIGDNLLFIPGIDTGAGDVLKFEMDNSQPGMTNPALVPYYQAYYQYLISANLAMEQGYLPLSLLDFIRSYFTNIEP